jgi:hypothetical protein
MNAELVSVSFFYLGRSFSFSSSRKSRAFCFIPETSSGDATAIPNAKAKLVTYGLLRKEFTFL